MSDSWHEWEDFFGFSVNVGEVIITERTFRVFAGVIYFTFVAVFHISSSFSSG